MVPGFLRTDLLHSTSWEDAEKREVCASLLWSSAAPCRRFGMTFPKQFRHVPTYSRWFHLADGKRRQGAALQSRGVFAQ